MEEEREADRLAVEAGEHDFGVRPRPEQALPQVPPVATTSCCEVLVFGQLADEFEDQRAPRRAAAGRMVSVRCRHVNRCSAGPARCR